MGSQRLVIGLGASPHDRRQGVPNRPDVPAADPCARGQVHGDDLTRTGEPDVILAVHVEVQALGGVELPRRGIGEVLGRDQVLVGRQAHVADVDATEQAVPVAVVGLAPVEMIARQGPSLALDHRIHLGRGSKHLGAAADASPNNYYAQPNPQRPDEHLQRHQRRHRQGQQPHHRLVHGAGGERDRQKLSPSQAGIRSTTPAPQRG